ncbi:hypothetical protein DFJ73DRAFT_551385 [Zopfochytrium polystomum]|nr:hypothetical protein DFJ73DRAFT_551385 [Zopfochytrium polystomum]
MAAGRKRQNAQHAMAHRHRPLSLLLLLAALLATTFTAPALAGTSWQSTKDRQKVLLKDVSVLTLYEGKMTNGRRSAPVPQLKCVGGDACHAAGSIRTIQCLNKGFDGRDVQWECRGELEDHYKFGRTDVSCEGYAHPDDPYILAGSCGVEYTLYYTAKGKRSAVDGRYPRGWQSWWSPSRWSDWWQSDALDDDLSAAGLEYGGNGSSLVSRLVWIVVAGIFLYSFWSSCMSVISVNARMAQPRRRGNYFGGWGGWDGGSGPGFGPNTGNGGGSPSDSGSSTASTQRPGFWSGLALGGFLGNIFGRNRNDGYRYAPRGFTSGIPYRPSQIPRRPSPPRSTSSSWSSSSSSSSRMATGYGGTRRR